MADDALANAMAKAKEVAARLTGELSSSSASKPNGDLFGLKRSATDNLTGGSSEKRPVSEMLTAAAEAAAKISQKIGNVGGGVSSLAVGSGLSTFELPVTDKIAGLVIGRNGENITRLQAESSCRIQVSPEVGGGDRVATLTGTSSQIELAKKLIGEIVDKNRYLLPLGSDAITVDMMIPGMRAGIVIGKNGDTIKNLQESCGVKMMLIQDSCEPGVADKPLRISGPKENVDKAKDAIVALLQNKEAEKNAAKTSAPTAVSTDLAIYPIPTDKAGVIIGKGGENIRDLAAKSGAHVEISRNSGPDALKKYFHIRGTRDQINTAVHLMCERVSLPMEPFTAYYPVGTAQPSISDPVVPYPATNQQHSTAWNPYQQHQQQPSQYPGWQQPTGYSGGPMSQPAASNSAMHHQYPQQSAGQPAQSHDASAPVPSLNPATGQMDYSAAWIEYYRKMGMHEHAEMVIKQTQAQAGVQGPIGSNVDSSQHQPRSADVSGQVYGGPQNNSAYSQPYAPQAFSGMQPPPNGSSGPPSASGPMLRQPGATSTDGASQMRPQGPFYPRGPMPPAQSDWSNQRGLAENGMSARLPTQPQQMVPPNSSGLRHPYAQGVMPSGAVPRPHMMQRPVGQASLNGPPSQPWQGAAANENFIRQPQWNSPQVQQASWSGPSGFQGQPAR